MHTLYPALKAIIQQDDKFLVIQQEYAGVKVWDLPGGKVEYGENPYDTLHREVREELGLSIQIVKPLGLFWFFRQDGAQVICTTFLCSSTTKTIDITMNPADEYITQYKWVSKKEFLTEDYQVSHPSLKDLIAHL